jgi:hypothetical protein
MKYPRSRNPKAETRRPKEGRRPKSEYSGASETPNARSAFWRWADEASAESLVLRDCEADDAVSGKEFKQKIGTCRKESKESMFFLRMVGTAEEGLAAEARVLWREAKELNLIFGAIWRK